MRPESLDVDEHLQEPEELLVPRTVPLREPREGVLGEHVLRQVHEVEPAHVARGDEVAEQPQPRPLLGLVDAEHPGLQHLPPVRV